MSKSIFDFENPGDRAKTRIKRAENGASTPILLLATLGCVEFIFVCFTQQGAERIILKDIRRAQPIKTTDTKSASFLGFVGFLCIAALSFQSLASQNAAVVEKQSLRADVIQSEVESALGIATAHISVRIQRGNSIENYIPWLAKTTPIIRIALPQNWIDQRSKQVGGSDASMQMLMDLVYNVEPTAIVEIVFVQNIPVATATANTSEPSPKQIAIIAGLLALLLSGSFIDRRRRKEEICICDCSRRIKNDDYYYIYPPRDIPQRAAGERTFWGGKRFPRAQKIPTA